MSLLGSSMNRGNGSLLTALLFTVMFLVREVAAKNFVLNVGHLGRREPVVQPAISKGQLDLKVVGCVLGEGKREGEGRDEPRT
jgi:hypothetical protein